MTFSVTLGELGADLVLCGQNGIPPTSLSVIEW